MDSLHSLSSAVATVALSPFPPCNSETRGVCSVDFAASSTMKQASHIGLTCLHRGVAVASEKIARSVTHKIEQKRSEFPEKSQILVETSNIHKNGDIRTFTLQYLHKT